MGGDTQRVKEKRSAYIILRYKPEIKGAWKTWAFIASF
jgi:hypothetical protein